MSYEECHVHPGEEATNGCRLCKCPDCGSPLELHGHDACLYRQIEQRASTADALRSALRALVEALPKCPHRDLDHATGDWVTCGDYATRVWLGSDRDEEYYCELHWPHDEKVPWAEPLREALALLATSTDET